MSTSRYGVGISPDSVAYISSAKSLLSGSGYLLYDGHPYIQWPPLFPAMLAALGLVGIQPIDGARYVNAIIFGLIIFTSGQILLRHIRSKNLALLGAVFILLSPPLLSVSVMAWTEPLFTLLAILFIIQLGKLLNKRRFSDLFWLAAIAALSCLQRYVGIIIILTGFAVILYPNKETNLIQRSKQSLLFGIMSSLPMILWVIRNYLLIGSFAERRPPVEYTLGGNFILTCDTITTWFLPQRIPLGVRSLIACIAVLSFAIAFLGSEKIESRPGIQRIQIWFAGVFTFLYTVFLIVGATFYAALGPIGERFLAPIYVFVIFMTFIGVDCTLQLLKHYRRGKRISLLFVIAWLSTWSMLSAFRISESVQSRMKDGAGVFTTTSWRESPLIDYLRMKPLEGRILSNAPDAIYIFTDMVAQLIPSRYADITEVRKSMSADGPSYLVWFENIDRPHLYSWQELASLFKIRELARFHDGSIYLIE